MADPFRCPILQLGHRGLAAISPPAVCAQVSVVRALWQAAHGGEASQSFTNRRCKAAEIASERLVTPSFWKMMLVWNLTVRSVM